MSTDYQILGINHLGIAAKDPKKAKEFFGATLGLPHLGNETVQEQGVKTSIHQSCHSNNPDTSRLELLEPIELTTGPIAKYIDKKGGGIHHIALTVSNIENAIADMLAKGVTMIDSSPRPGVHNTKIAFIHPKSTGGILVELVEEN